MYDKTKAIAHGPQGKIAVSAFGGKDLKSHEELRQFLCRPSGYAHSFYPLPFSPLAHSFGPQSLSNLIHSVDLTFQSPCLKPLPAPLIYGEHVAQLLCSLQVSVQKRAIID